jgi:glycine cleavage system aminomethyltransferase T
VQFESVSESRDVLMVNGPESKNILEAANPVFGEKWPLFRWKKVSLFGHDDIYALKVSFIGELGFELHTPSGAVGADIYRNLVADPKMGDWGGAAMNSMRLEKGIPLFGKDFTKDHSALEVGLHPKFVKLDKPTDFVGKEALKKELADAESGATKLRKLVMFEIDLAAGVDMGKAFSYTGEARENDTDIADCTGNEPLFDNKTGKCVGFITSGAPGFCTGQSVAMGYVPEEMAKEGAADLSVELLGVRYAAIVRDKPAMLSWGPRQKLLKKQREQQGSLGGGGSVPERTSVPMHAAPPRAD